ncbi:hypothetical protein PR202_ga31056 [Eleusine coracana subsp. coracana]|uniref:Reverse transcriptase zinc-binding domain-containing protein n=1 Tax=Eleusine coracana subsp. coracana TaxID=191504 RepID=A0AAV5DP21_ELECO|nr:hypothetical protein PR202_ga31056 [Eleusine coracana subsp. coracana]
MADQLAKRGLDHPEHCVLCDQEEETVQHILVGCVFARDFWFRILQAFNLQQLAPGSNESDFASWWKKASNRVAKQHRKGLNTLIILGAWTIWKHRNAVVFDGLSPNIQLALDNLRLEAQLWAFAGARSLGDLGLGRLLSAG